MLLIPLIRFWAFQLPFPSLSSTTSPRGNLTLPRQAERVWRVWYGVECTTSRRHNTSALSITQPCGWQDASLVMLSVYPRERDVRPRKL